MSDITEITSDLYFTKTGGGSVRIYVNSGSATGLAAVNYDSNTNSNYFIINSELQTISIPSGTEFKANEMVISNLTVASITGNTGARGAQGVQGIVGLQAIQGLQGLQGTQGSQAAQGSQGWQGIQGAQGLAGVSITGFQGVQGPQGTQGFDGWQGLSKIGFNGLQGIQGFQGVVGLDGIQGLQGRVGRQGTQGTQGTQGIEGWQGIQGRQGRQGTLGIQGAQGPQGIQGAQGSLGTQGAIGRQGPQGFQGGFNPTTNFVNYNLLLSDGTTTGARSQTGLSYTGGVFRVVGNALSITGDCNVSGLLRTYITNNSPSGYINTNVGSTQITEAAIGSFITKVAGPSREIGYNVTSDSLGNSYFVGQGYTGTTVYNSDGTIFKVFGGSGTPNVDGWIVKYGPTGMASWATYVSGSSTDEGKAVGYDSLGNVYMAGRGGSPYTIYNSDNTSFATMSYACFVVQFGSTGMGKWRAGMSSSNITDMSIDINDNIYVASWGTSNTVYNSDGTIFKSLGGSGNNDGYVTSYGNTGMGRWATRISGTLNDATFSIDTDNFSNSYVTGRCQIPVTFYNSDNSAFNTLTSGSGNAECFIAKYGPTGMGSWVTRISGVGDDLGNHIAADNLGNSYVTGYYNQTGTFYNSDGSAFTSLGGSGLSECFVTKYGPTGMCNWVTRISGVGNEQGFSIDVDSDGNSYVIGNFSSPAVVYNSDGTIFKTISGGSMFVVKYNPTGFGLLSFISTISSSLTLCISVDSSKNIYITGESSTATFYNSNGSIFAILNNSETSNLAFILKYTQQYYLQDLAYDVSNIGKIVTIFNTTPTLPQTVNLVDINNVQYDTTTITYSKQFVFYNNRWNVL